MELDRNAIERADFAQARRGYDPDEVDAHLAEVAVAVEQLKASASAPAGRAAAGSLAGAAADQVRTIVEAAERSAAEIESGARTEADRVTGEAKRQAEQDRSEAQSDASRTRSEAESEATQAREQAESDAAGHVAQVEAATTDMRRRADAVGTDLHALADQLRSTIDNMLESVRSSAGSLETELGGIKAGLAQLEPVTPSGADAAAVSVDQVEPLDADEPATAGDPDTGDVAAGAPATAYDDEFSEPAGEVTAYDDELSEPAGEVTASEGHEDAEPAAEEPSTPMASGRGDGGEGARLIALNMALNGTPRDETSRYLEENFDLQDREGILDEVYARVGG
ncbi:MAG: DivIVA domain-containing protein [Thermoleophilaceae bacterium]